MLALPVSPEVPLATAKLTFAPATDFHGELKRRVDAYFVDNGIEKSANGAMALKTIFWLSFTWGSWALVLSERLPTWAQFLAWGAIGFGLAAIGFNVGHDAIHGAYSSSKTINRMLSWSFDIMGASSFTWSVAHNVVHHTYTNIVGVDKDLEPGPTMVFYPQQTRAYHRFQHLYAWFLYGFVGIIWVYLKDFDQIRQADPLTGRRASAGDWAKVIVGKVLHLTLLMGVPLVVMHAPVWQILLGYTLMLYVGGFTLAIVFQLAHVVEGVVFPRVPTDAKRMPEAWAEHQLRTTANFGKTPLATFICGGLDHQIEHHLMPRICHIHYPKLAPIVQQCAKDHGLPYVYSGSFFTAVGSHARTLRALGNDEFVVDSATATTAVAS